MYTDALILLGVVDTATLNRLSRLPHATVTYPARRP